jgi:hypothetical protein
MQEARKRKQLPLFVGFLLGLTLMMDAMFLQYFELSQNYTVLLPRRL